MKPEKTNQNPKSNPNQPSKDKLQQTQGRPASNQPTHQSKPQQQTFKK